MEPTQGVLTEQQKDGIKEEIKFNTELIKIFALIALATGVLSLGTPLLLAEAPVKGEIKLILALGSGILFTFITIIIILISKNMKKINLLQ